MPAAATVAYAPTVLDLRMGSSTAGHTGPLTVGGGATSASEGKAAEEAVPLWPTATEDQPLPRGFNDGSSNSNASGAALGFAAFGACRNTQHNHTHKLMLNA